MPPLLSVVMPVFNGEEFLAEAIESILLQTYTDFEFLIVDDASTDRTPNILQKYKQQDSRIQVITNPQNKRVAATINSTHAKTAGKYVARMDSDDIAMPTRFEKQIAFMENNPDIDVCGTQAIYHESNKSFTLPTTHQELGWTLLRIPPIANPTSMVKKELLDKARGLDPEMLPSADYDFWVRVFFEHKARFANLPEQLLRYRYHPNRDRNAYKQNQKIKSSLVHMKVLAYVDNIYGTSFAEDGFPGITSFNAQNIETLLKCSRNFKILFQKNPALQYFPQKAIQNTLLGIANAIEKIQ